MKKIIMQIVRSIPKELWFIMFLALIFGSVLAELIIIYQPAILKISLRLSLPLAMIVIILFLIGFIGKYTGGREE